MCGIVGAIFREPQDDFEMLKRQCDALSHRGPDDSGVWVSEDRRVGFAHRRLAIVDLSRNGRQPMRDVGETVVITFNGEIYNYLELRQELESLGQRFRSKTDTEVILAAYKQWGIDCVDHFNGMFAFALYDISRRLCVIARDRAGEKPLYYSFDGRAFRFASELKALMADPSFPRKLDPDSLNFYLSYGFVPGEKCILKGTSKLPPAHTLVLDVTRWELNVRRYWQKPAFSPTEPTAVSSGAPAIADELQHLLSDSVRSRLIADVPVGILLSGGIDSSLITALAVHAGKNVKVFTVRFPYNEELDETAHARLIANHFGVEHIELTAEPTSIELLPLLAAQFDEPLADSSMVPMHLVCKMTAQHCKVALGGDGGDELFGGYEHYTRLLKMKRLFAGAPGGLRKMLGNFADKVLPFTARGRNWIVNMGCDPESEAPHIAQLFNGRARKQLIKDDVFAGIRDPEAPEKLWRILSAEGTDIVQRASGADFEAFLPEDILVKVDRASMLNSLELRAPMLDHKVIEFSIAKIPSELKVVPDARKVILRLIGEKFFPPTFDWDRKQGFCIPLASWLRNEWKPVFEELLVKTESRVFNRSALQQLWKWGRNGLGNPERIFALALFELWLDIYRIEVD